MTSWIMVTRGSRNKMIDEHIIESIPFSHLIVSLKLIRMQEIDNSVKALLAFLLGQSIIY